MRTGHRWARCAAVTKRGAAARNVPAGGDAGLPVDGKVQPVAPLGPAAVVDRDVLEPEHVEDVRELRRGDSRAVVADEAAATGDVRLEEDRAELGGVPQMLRPG